MRKKKIGLLWATIGLIVVLGILGILNKWETLSWMFYAAVSVVVTGAAIITSRQKIPSDAHPNKHNPLLRDNAPYNCIHGIAPHATTGYCAWPIGHLENTPEPSDEQRRIKVYKQSDR